MNRSRVLRKLGDISYALSALLLITSLVVNVLPTNAVMADAGAIWTTEGDCGDVTQNVNQFDVGDHIYINGDNFAAGDTDWYIKGKPGGASCDPNSIVASGTHTIDATGAFCFAAYIVADDDCGVYSYKVGNKNDNYSVEGITAAPALSLTKSASPTTYSAVGNVISYSYVLTNTGNVAIDTLVVSDDKASVTCLATTLAASASTTCSASYVIGQADLDFGSVTNTAQAQGLYGGEPVLSNEASATVTAVVTRAISLLKSANPPTYTSAGQTITYTYTITNNSNVTLAGPFTITDDKAGTQSPCGSGPLAPGASTSCTMTYNITQADLDYGSVTNTAVATGNDLTSNEAQATVNAITNRSIVLEKSADPLTYDTLGQTITYTYTITNAGNVTLAGPFTVNDDKAGTQSPCGSGPLAPGASTSCTMTYNILQADLDNGSVTNTATATGNDLTSNQAQATVVAETEAGILLEKEADPLTYDTLGETITYTYTITNTGTITLDGPFTVTDDKAGTQSPCGSGPLAPGADTSCTLTYNITQADLDAGSVTNIAYATGNNLRSNNAQATVNAVPNPALGLEKSADPVTYDTLGETITYTYTITNTGNVTLDGPFTITDDKAGVESDCGTGPLAPGDSTSCTMTYNITQADLDNGSVTNTATASGNGVTSNQAQATVDAIQSPAIGLDKSADPTIYTTAGQTITYTYTITNDGNVTLAGPFTITDDKAGVKTPCGSGPLAPGASTSCTMTYAITQADMDAGSVTNTAVATGNGLESEPAQATVDAEQTPSLLLVKFADPLSYNMVGQVIDYTYQLTNDGNVTLSEPFIIDDDLADDESCPSVPTLAPGEWLTCTASYTITQNDIDAGSVTNVAIGSAMYNPIIYSNEDTATVTVTEEGLPLPSVTQCYYFLTDEFMITISNLGEEGYIGWSVDSDPVTSLGIIPSGADDPAAPFFLPGTTTSILLWVSFDGVSWTEAGSEDLNPEILCEIDPVSLNNYCDTTTGNLIWTVGNLNPIDILYIWTWAGSGVFSAPRLVPAGGSDSFQTAAQAGAIEIYTDTGQHLLDTSAAVSCQRDEPEEPIEIPVTGGTTVLIPVTGLDLGAAGKALSYNFLFLSISFLGIGLVLKGFSRRYEE